MVLPSQTARPVRRRTYMHRSRPKRGRRGLLIVSFVAIIGLLAGMRLLIPRGGDGGEVDDPATAQTVVAAPEPVAPPEGTEQHLTTAPTHPKPAPSAPPIARRTAASMNEPASAPTKLVTRTPPHATPPAPRPATDPATAETVSKPITPAIAAPRLQTPPAGLRPAPANTPPTPAGIRAELESGLQLANSNQPVEARRVLSRALASGQLSPADAAFTRDTLQTLNRRLVFSSQVVDGDPFAVVHTVGSGELLSTIVRDHGVAADWRFILRINGIDDARSLREGQRIKLVTGPFHAVVNKTDFRLDVWMGSSTERVYVTSLDVGLGEYDSTPLGRFRVRPKSRLINPAWVNPRTREQYDRDDPLNPIGEYWIGLEGIDEHNQDLAGYGIHGTIEPDSIGRQASMGCVRLRPDDVALVYELMSYESVVEIFP